MNWIKQLAQKRATSNQVILSFFISLFNVIFYALSVRIYPYIVSGYPVFPLVKGRNPQIPLPIINPKLNFTFGGELWKS